MMQPDAAPPTAARPVSAARSAPLRLDAAELFAGAREVIIVHAGETYRLRLTRQDKLILTK